ncbi:MAG TPA: glutamate-5-semialdehyde dehydrogenase [Lachnospiraceae bacterium]|nr:glutamate-5-semialdehyde dehydrogenase [Lachnospiraceae bacterium]
MSVRERVLEMKAVSPSVAAAGKGVRNEALRLAACSLREHQQEIFDANREDLERAQENGIAPAIMKRLKFDAHKLADCLAGIESLIGLEDPAGKVTLHRQLDEGLVLKRVTVPIGVIGIIFEARPDALVQISCLCIKSGNCAVLKGGKETASTNKVLFDLIAEAALKAGLPAGCLLQVSAHSEIDELLECDDCVDLLIPRGSNAFVRYIMDHTRIPVMGHSDGICHTYVDKAADFDLAIPVLIDAKTQYTAACNATETLLVHRDIAETFLPKAAKALGEAGVRLRGTAEVARILEAAAKKGGIAPEDVMEETDFRTEYLDLVLSVKLVDSVEEACAHINRYGSHHTDCIITEDDAAAERFMTLTDSAGVYRNCSTRFADGFRYGFGAEVGISTSKLHARGPVGLDGLVTYKYLLEGTGQTVADYASGKKQFHFQSIPT